MYTINILSNNEFDNLGSDVTRGSDISNSLGFANKFTGQAYVRHTGISELQKYLVDHEFDELIDARSEHEDENGIRHKSLGNLFGGGLGGIKDSFLTTGNKPGGALTGVRQGAQSGGGLLSGLGNLAGSAAKGIGSGLSNLFGSPAFAQTASATPRATSGGSSPGQFAKSFAFGGGGIPASFGGGAGTGRFGAGQPSGAGAAKAPAGGGGSLLDFFRGDAFKLLGGAGALGAGALLPTIKAPDPNTPEIQALRAQVGGTAAGQQIRSNQLARAQEEFSPETNELIQAKLERSQEQRSEALRQAELRFVAARGSGGRSGELENLLRDINEDFDLTDQLIFEETRIAEEERFKRDRTQAEQGVISGSESQLNRQAGLAQLGQQRLTRDFESATQKRTDQGDILSKLGGGILNSFFLSPQENFLRQLFSGK